MEQKIEEMRKESVRLRRALETELTALKRTEERSGEAKGNLERSLAEGREAAKFHRMHQEAKEKREFQEMKVRGIEAEIERIEREIVELDASLRAKRIDEADKRIREILASCRKRHEEMTKEMIEVAALSEVIDKNVAIRRERIRVDHVRCLILDPRMRRIGANKKVAYVGRVRKEDPKLSYHVETFVEEGGEVYAHIGYEIAKRLEKEGRAKIVENGKPKYDVRIVEDPRPAIVEDLKSLSLGRSITIDGKRTEFFDEVRKVFGYDPEITPDTMFQMLFEKKYAGMRRVG
jgi:hypothetical protein